VSASPESPRIDSVRRALLTHADRYIPDRLRATADQQLRARVVVLFARVGLPVSLFFFIAYALESEWRIAVIDLVTIPIVLIVPLQLRRLQSLPLAGHVLIATVFTNVALTAVFLGGLDLATLTWLVMLPLTANMVINLRAGAFWFLAGLTVFIVLLIGDVTGLPFPERQVAPTPVLDIIGVISLMFCIFLHGALYDELKGRALVELEAQQAALEQARADAVAANHAKSSFLANMSHEIRTPLNGLLGMTELLKHARLDAPHGHYVEVAHRSGQALLSVVDDVLDFSKIEAGRMEIERAPVNVADVVDDVITMLEPKGLDKQIDLVGDIDESVPPRLLGDGVRLRQVLLNLTGNALKFTDAGEVRLALRYDAGVLSASVIDTGVGIAADRHQSIFDAFAQADSSTTRRFGGTGLGLSISRQLAELMGGTLTVESAPGEGATFTLRVPLPPAAAEAAAAPDASARPLEGLNVLIVDDNAINRRVAELLVAQAGGRSTSADGGVQALACASEQAPDVVLMDCEMPDMDGFATTAELLNQATAGPRPIIVAVSAHTDEANRKACADAGMAAFIGKPVRYETLIDVLAPLVKDRPQRAA
jgi:signal transduction histidine kinase/ActR/RegA family two-component response regulator